MRSPLTRTDPLDPLPWDGAPNSWPATSTVPSASSVARTRTSASFTWKGASRRRAARNVPSPSRLLHPFADTEWFRAKADGERPRGPSEASVRSIQSVAAIASGVGGPAPALIAFPSAGIATCPGYWLSFIRSRRRAGWSAETRRQPATTLDDPMMDAVLRVGFP